MSNLPSIEPAASVADRHVKAAQAALVALQDVNLGDFDQREQLKREVEFALDAAQVYSRLAVAEAVERSFPALPDAFEFTLGGDVIDFKMREHMAQVEQHADQAKGRWLNPRGGQA